MMHFGYMMEGDMLLRNGKKVVTLLTDCFIMLRFSAISQEEISDLIYSLRLHTLNPNS